MAENGPHQEVVQESIASMDALIINCLAGKLNSVLKNAINLAAAFDGVKTFQIIEEIINKHASTVYEVEESGTYQVSLFLTPVIVISRGA